MSFVCETCGKSHEGSQKDFAWKLPDDVWGIPANERENHARFTSDLCQLGERYFIRCVLPIPLKKSEDSFNWGVWAEVEWPTFERYLKIYEADAENEPHRIGSIANAIPGYPPVAESVKIHFGKSTARPKLYFEDTSCHPLALEQRLGIDGTKHHEILKSIGAET